jgi:hypothetical protein
MTDPELLREWARESYANFCNLMETKAWWEDLRNRLYNAADAMEERNILRKQEDAPFQEFYEVREALRELVGAGDDLRWNVDKAVAGWYELDKAIANAKEILGE